MQRLAAMTMLATLTAGSFQAAADDSIGATFMLDELEYVVDDGADPIAWSAALAVGNSERQLWLVSEGGHNRGTLEEHEVHAYLAQALGDSATLIMGWRGDLKPEPDRNWGMLGIENTWLFDIESSLATYFGSDGDTALRFKLGREWTLAPRLTLVPELETNAFGQTDLETGVGSGFADIEIAARLFYALSDSATAYVGAVWAQPLGNTRDIARAEGEGGSESAVLLGFSFEF